MESLVYHAGALGDFITALPAIDLWREAHPEHRHILLGRPAYATLALPAFDDVWDAGSAAFASLFSVDEPRMASLPAKMGELTSALLFANEASPLPRVLTRLGVKEIRRQDPFPSSPIHVVDHHLALFPRSVRDGRGIPRIAFLRQEPAMGVAAIHPGSGSVLKNWPFARYEELAALLDGRVQGIAWIVGPAESGLGPFRPAEGQDHPDVWDSLPLPVLAARLSRCRLYVGNDSGITHLAAAAGCPTVALFGASDPQVWAPRGENVTVVDSRVRGIGSLRVEDVLRVCLELLKEK